MQTTGAQPEDFEYLGLVENRIGQANLPWNAGAAGQDRCWLWGTVDGVDYLARVRSAYLAHYTANLTAAAADITPADGWLRLVPRITRNDSQQTLFDCYHVYAYATRFQRGADGSVVVQNGRPVEEAVTVRGHGRHYQRRGLEAVLELRKIDISGMVPSALYIDGDPDPQWSGASWRVSGADHSMNGPVGGPMIDCPDCAGGQVASNPLPCGACGGGWVYNKGPNNGNPAPAPADPANPPSNVDPDPGTGSVDVPCTGCNGTLRVSIATNQSVSSCGECNMTGTAVVTCPVAEGGCGGAKRVYIATGAPAPACGTCGGTGEVTVKKKKSPCPACKICPKCTGTGQINKTCTICKTCPTCGGDNLMPTDCAACTAGWTAASFTDCPNCNSTPPGLIPDGGGGGQPDEEAFRTNIVGNSKAGLGYPGTWAAVSGGMNNATQVQTLQTDPSGNPQIWTGEAAMTNNKVNLRDLAAAFVGDPPDPARIDNWNNNNLDTSKIGTKADFQITYVDGDTGTVAGQNEGAGVLIVNGDMKISGQFTWYGLIIVLGSIEMTGGGNGIHIYGSVMGAELHDNTQSDAKVGGQSDIWWCQEAMDRVMKMRPTFRVYPVTTSWRSRDKAEVEADEQAP